jgi:hypothetical protein
MHNEFVGKRAPKSAAFVCFKPAEEGGEFLLGDGRKILAELDTELVSKLYNRKIRYSVRLVGCGGLCGLPGGAVLCAGCVSGVTAVPLCA